MIKFELGKVKGKEKARWSTGFYHGILFKLLSMDTEEGLGDMTGVGQVVGGNIKFRYGLTKFSWKDMVVRSNWYTDPNTRKKVWN